LRVNNTITAITLTLVGTLGITCSRGPDVQRKPAAGIPSRYEIKTKAPEFKGTIYFVSGQGIDPYKIFSYDITRKRCEEVGTFRVGSLLSIALSRDGRYLFYGGISTDQRGIITVMAFNEKTGRFKTSKVFETSPGASNHIIYDDWDRKLYYRSQPKPYIPPKPGGYPPGSYPKHIHPPAEYGYIDMTGEPRIVEAPGARIAAFNTIAVSKKYIYYLEDKAGKRYLVRKPKNASDYEYLASVPDNAWNICVLNGERACIIDTMVVGPKKECADCYYYVRFNADSGRLGSWELLGKEEPRYDLTAVQSPSALNAEGVLLAPYRARLENHSYVNTVSFYDVRANRVYPVFKQAVPAAVVTTEYIGWLYAEDAATLDKAEYVNNTMNDIYGWSQH